MSENKSSSLGVIFMSKKLEIEGVKQDFIKRGYIPIFTEYINNNEKLDCKDSDGYKYSISLGNLKRGNKPFMFEKHNPHSMYNIKLWIKLNRNNLTILDDEYTGTHSKYTFEDNEGYKFELSICDLVGFKTQPLFGNNNPHSMYNINLWMEQNCSDYKFISKEVGKIKDKHEFECGCNHRFKMTIKDFIYGGQRCPICANINKSGKNHYRYNPNLTEEEREKNRRQLHGENQVCWNRKVLKRDNYTCKCCGQHGYKLVAHHLNGYNWDIENRFSVDNGVTLCENCHKEFHHIYGYGDNTKEQYEEFIENKNKEKESA